MTKSQDNLTSEKHIFSLPGPALPQVRICAPQKKHPKPVISRLNKIETRKFRP